MKYLMEKRPEQWQWLSDNIISDSKRNVINNKRNIQKWHRIKAMKQRCIAFVYYDA